eukprot:s51_g13.t1
MSPYRASYRARISLQILVRGRSTAEPRGGYKEPGAATEPPKKRVKAEVGEVTTVLSDEEVEIEDDDMPLVPARHFLQGMPSIGFSETWLRQFMSQMPRTRSKEGTPSNARVGRKVLGASGDQLVYVDAISPGEMLLLMQFVFMLEEPATPGCRSGESNGIPSGVLKGEASFYGSFRGFGTAGVAYLQLSAGGSGGGCDAEVGLRWPALSV